MKKELFIGLALVFPILLFSCGGGGEEKPYIEMVSVNPAGLEGNGPAGNFAVSRDGRYVAFDSDASDLVEGDTNGKKDVFLRDMATGVTTRVSVNTAGEEANAYSGNPAISSDGHFVAFVSWADNLEAGDNNATADIFVRNTVSGVTSRVSEGAFHLEANGSSDSPSISSDGMYVAFLSYASNLVDGDNNGYGDVFVRDRLTGTTTRVSVSSEGTEGNRTSSRPHISGDARYVVFESSASTLESGNTGGMFDVFLHDRKAGTTARVSVGPSGAEANGHSYSPAISADGQFVAFESEASDLVAGDTNDAFDIFVYGLAEGETHRVSVDTAGEQGDSNSWTPHLTEGGRYVVFGSYASNLVEQDGNGLGDVFIRDRLEGSTTRISTSSPGGEGDANSVFSDVSGDGRYAIFRSEATNLLQGTVTSGQMQVYRVRLP